MPRYSYTCSACGCQVIQMRPIAKRDDSQICVECGRGFVKRDVDAPLGLLTGLRTNSTGEVSAELLSDPRIPNITARNVTIVGCGQAAIRMEHGRMRIDGLNIIDTQPAFELSGGATVEASNVIHHAGNPNRRFLKKPKKST